METIKKTFSNTLTCLCVSVCLSLNRTVSPKRTRNDLQGIHSALVSHPPFSRLFPFNAPCRFTPLLNLHSLVFGLTLSGWLICIFLKGISLLNYLFFFNSSPLFQELNWGVREVLVIGFVRRNYGLFYFSKSGQ
jgi:hypothetical protein